MNTIVFIFAPAGLGISIGVELALWVSAFPPFIERMQMAHSAYADGVFDSLTTDSVLERIQLYSKGAAVERGLIKAGCFGVPRGENEIQALGCSIDVLAFARRPKAVDVSGTGGCKVIFDPTHADFERIRRESQLHDSGCMYGISFLVLERMTQRLNELFLCTKYTRPEAKKFFRYLPLTAADIVARGLRCKPRGPMPATLEATPIPAIAKYVSFSLEVKECETPIENLLSKEELELEIAAFLNP